MKKRKKRKGISTLPGMRSMRCPECGSPVVLKSADGIYHTNPDHVQLYVCSRYPQCDTYVRTPPGTTIPMGTLANRQLRRLRVQAHKSFDRLYRSGLMGKDDAYRWLASVVQAPMSCAHIGYLGDYYCKKVIDESDALFTQLRSRARYPLASGGE